MKKIIFLVLIFIIIFQNVAFAYNVPIDYLDGGAVGYPMIGGTTGGAAKTNTETLWQLGGRFLNLQIPIGDFNLSILALIIYSTLAELVLSFIFIIGMRFTKK